MSELPSFSPGSHVDIYLPERMTRSYSLLNNADETHRYVIAVQKDINGRGGSRFFHENVHVGDVLTIGSPRNNFALDESSQHSVFIAGGIGITPFLSMIRRLEVRGESWELHYATRSRQRCAFLNTLQAMGGSSSRVHLFFNDESAATQFDLGSIIRDAAAVSHFYCCGPLPMLDAFEAATVGLPSGTVHVEYFMTKEKVNTSGGFSVELAKSGRSVIVKSGETILDALLNAGIVAPYSCREGICGSCEVKVLEGIPDHRDLVLTTAERESNATIFICCSGSKSAKLALDL
jgi:vanillate O-demethylase ferredoxin subunit